MSPREVMQAIQEEKAAPSEPSTLWLLVVDGKVSAFTFGERPGKAWSPVDYDPWKRKPTNKARVAATVGAVMAVARAGGGE